MIDTFLVAHGMTHPDIWMLWAALIASGLNALATIGLLVREKR
jgi:hypothetical protein